MACESEQNALQASKTALNNIIKRDKINYFKTNSEVIKKAQQRVNNARAALYKCKNNVSKKKTGGESIKYEIKKRKTDKKGNIKKYKAVGRNLYNSDDVLSKSTLKMNRKGSSYKEKSDTIARTSGDAHVYGDKKLWKRRFKSKDDRSGTEIKRKEKIVFDDGNQMTKRKQKKIRFGKNKGKIKSKTVNYNRGKRTVTKRLLNKTDKTKLQKGGFLEAPITRLFED